ncbi:MAG: FtsW/RodA/SpoVE family cell cycle protein [Ruminococcaceae bacterium]|nr:FtsW/RodA/SpoVE family cell cycle protein [Oscillospiraceae bacterium]
MRYGKRSAFDGLRSFVRYSNLRLILLCILASAFGCILVYSWSYGVGQGFGGVSIQIIASILGFLIALFISRVDYENICALWPLWTGFSLLLVLLTYTPLGLNAAGTDDTAWLAIGPITFQPSELLKISFIISMSMHLVKVQEHIREFKTVLLLGMHGAFHIFLVFLQGDDGTALVFIAIFLSMMLVSGVNLLYFIIGFAGVFSAIPILWTFFMSDDKKARFLCILPGYIDRFLETEGWQQFEALKSIGSGQLTGVGYLEGHNPDLFARNNDLIFIVAAEEFGFIGGMLLFVLIALLVYELYRSARMAQDALGSYLCIGMMALIGFQSLINLGMNLRVLPVIGITLPFFSDGGSSVLTLYLGIGLALSVSFSERTRRRNGLSRM